jgi:hypothetical protein
MTSKVKQQQLVCERCKPKWGPPGSGQQVCCDPKCKKSIRGKKIRQLGYNNASAVDLGDDGIRIQEIWCNDCILNWKS